MIIGDLFIEYMTGITDLLNLQVVFISDGNEGKSPISASFPQKKKFGEETNVYTSLLRHQSSRYFRPDYEEGVVIKIQENVHSRYQRRGGEN